MTDRYSEDETIATVTRLTRSQLVWFVEASFVRPERDDTGYVFRSIDIARLELLCDLALDLEFDEAALGIIVSLIDQLHAARTEAALMARAIDALPEDLKAAVVTGLRRPA
jgi:chaperone modulatory protein CbpM